MRVLYYNWVDYLDPAGRGGGVSQYQRMLMAELGRMDGVDPFFLCAGLAHRLRPGAPGWQPIRHGPRETRGRRFTLVDSQPNSPSHHSFGMPEQLAHAPTERALADFVATVGPFDVIHFNNLEGLPARALSLREKLPNTRFVLSLHNYYPFCPQVNLWHREEAHCDDFDGGAACATCLPFRPDPRKVRLANAVAHRLDHVGLRPGIAVFDHGLAPAMKGGAYAFRWVASRKRRRASEAPAEANGSVAQGFARRRSEMVRLINRHCDRVLAVSERTAEIACSFGLDETLVEVMPIGTDHAGLYAKAPTQHRLPREDGTVSLAYLGYMRRDKGFYFLLDALEAMPSDLRSRLRIVIAAAARDGEALARMERLSTGFAEFRHIDGYRREDMDAILSDVDLGVIPSLWEDNLPQVALEMHCRRIPLLTSDRGGARELGNCADLQFKAGDEEALEARLQQILAGELDLGGYWQRARVPIDPRSHANSLRALYSSLVLAEPSNSSA